MMLRRLFGEMARVAGRRGAGRRSVKQAAAAFERGLELHSLDLREDALEQFVLAARLDATHRHAMIKAGMLLREMKRHDEALAWFDRALALQEDAFTLNERGICRLAAKYVEAAEADFRRAISLEPSHPGAHCNLGIALQLLRRKDEALVALRRAVALDLSVIEARCNLATALREADRHEEALLEVERAAELDPARVEPRILAGLLLRELGQPERAVRALQELSGSVEALCHLGLALQDLGDLPQSEHCYQRALELRPGDPQARFNRGLLRLLQGKFNVGWEDYAARMATQESPYRDFGCPAWQGEALEGKTLVVYAEQGLGDEIMFASCLPDLVQKTSSLVLDCDPRLGGLFERSFPQVRIVAERREYSPERVRTLYRPDFQLPAGDLPRLFRDGPESFGTGAAYLRADPERVEAWRARLHCTRGQLRVGVAWRGGVGRTKRVSRSLALETLLACVAGQGRSIVSLQHDASASEIAAAGGQASLHHWPDAFADFDELAGLLVSLDVVVTVCQTIVHLAGALGRPTLVLTPDIPEWRYGLQGSRMPWYGSVVLLRQIRAGRWDEPLSEAAQRLAAIEAVRAHA